ncbi:MAG TPA: hypothetical protein VM531_11950, partial [Sphingomicrobium sp.]|nr:hypothetical protein [Sphingomicrobium sp.]
MLVRAGDVPGAQPVLRRMRQVVGMRGDHHAVAGRQIKSLAGGEIDPRLRLEIAGDLRAEDRVPRKTVAAGDVHHQRDVAVRYRRQQALLFQAHEPRRGVRPGIEAVP